MAEFARRRRIMVDCQIRPSDITRQAIIEAMLEIPREEFVPSSMRDMAYIGDHLPLSDGRVLLDPRLLAKMLDAVNLGDRDLVLDIGSCLGYSSAVISRLADAVIALEEDETMVGLAGMALARCAADNAAAIAGCLIDGAAEHGPYDVIVIEGGVEMVPRKIIDQLVDGGRIACLHLAGSVGECRIGTKRDGRLTWRAAFDAMAPVMPGFQRQSVFAF